MIRRTAAGARRRQAIRQRLLASFAARTPEPEAPDPPERLVDTARERKRLARAVSGLSPRQAELMELVFHHELSVADAAGVLGISLGSARTHYARAKQNLAARLSRGCA